MKGHFGERLKELRKTAGITQSDLAEKLNIHLQTVSKWERNLSEPDISQLGELAEALGVSLEKLCGQEEAEQTFKGCFQAEKFGKTISEQRLARGESQDRLAEAMETSADAISRWERGITCPDIEKLTALAAHFEIPVSRLYCGIADEQTAEVGVIRRKKSAVWLAAVAASLCVVFGVLLAVFANSSVKTFTVLLDGKQVAVAENEWFTPATPSRDGYDFVGWEDESGAPVSFPCKITDNTSFVSVFEPTEYIVDYWLNGGYFEGSVQNAFTVESGSIELPVPEKAGQTFGGWYLNADYSGEPVERIRCAGANVKLYAKWSAVVFSVRYELNGGALYGENPETVTAEEEYPLAQPVRAGYVFLGWFDLPQGGEKHESVGGAAAENLTLYALWQRTDSLFTVYYDYEGEPEGENPVSVGAGEVHKLFGVKKTGFDFLGWNTKKDGSGEFVEYLYGIDETLRLYAVFQPKEYVVRYFYEGSYKGEESNPNTVRFGERVVLLPVYLYGHRFDGWFDAEEGGNRIEVLDESNILAVSNLYARYSPLEFFLRLEAGEGSFLWEGEACSAAEDTVQFGESLPLPECSLIGHTFLGWNEDPAGGGEFYTSFTGMEGDKTLYAVFAPKEYLLFYEYEGLYENGKVNPNYITYGEKVTLYPVYRDGYKFTGWYDAAEGGNRIAVIDESNLLSLSRLYARFSPLQFSIALDAGEGVFPTPQGERSEYVFTVAFDQTFPLPSCTLGGYTFLGWINESGESVSVIDKLNIRDMRLTAKWLPSDKSYTVTYVLNGGELAGENPETVLCGQVLTLREPEREGFLFLGWYDDAEGKGERYIATPADREEDLTLYALWQEIVVSGSAEHFDYEKTNSSVRITNYRGPVGSEVDVVIPAVVDGLPVTEIGSGKTYSDFAEQRKCNIFGGDATVRSITIPKGVRLLLANAFFGVTVFEPLRIPSTVKEIGDSCFYTFQGSVVFSEGDLTAIEANAFHGLHFPGVLQLPYGLKTIGRSAFYGVHTTGVILPETVETIYDSAFYQWDGRKRIIYLPSSVKYVGFRAFSRTEVYTPLGKEDTKSFDPEWCDGAVYGVRESEVTLKNGEETQILRGIAFSLPQPEKEGFTFLGWKDEEGNFVTNCYIPNRSAVLTAAFEEKSAQDGRTAGSAAVLEANRTYGFYLFDHQYLYVRPEFSESCKVLVSATDVAFVEVYRQRGSEIEVLRQGEEYEYVFGDLFLIKGEDLQAGTTVSVSIIRLSE